MSTKVQKKSLWWMIDAGGTMLIASGYKRVLIGRSQTTGLPMIAGNQNLILGLLNNKYVEKVGPMLYQITKLGRKAAGKQRPNPADHCNIPHTNHKYRRVC